MKTQMQIDFGRRLRDEGIRRAVDHANRKEDKWSDTAYAHFKFYLESKPHGFKFMVEDFRDHIARILAHPPHKRAFGALPLRARKEGLICKCGHGQVANPAAHRCFASVWIKV